MVKIAPSAVAKGVGLYFAAAVGGYLYLRSTKAPAPSPCGCGSGAPAQRHADEGTDATASSQETFDRIADRYDSLINVDETLMGLKLMRRWLMRHAEGDVLEVSAGTGRNMPYYKSPGIRSLTLTDSSRSMLVNAADKHAALTQGGAALPPVRFELADAQRLVDAAAGSGRESADSQQQAQQQAQQQQQQAQQQEQPVSPRRPVRKERRTFPPHSFDVVVDTFGLCSQDDPVTALKEMARVCKPGGRILLLQHGRGTWTFINNVLDNGAAQHFLRWGCWWNRDIERIVRQAGLHIDSMSRWHFGTTYMLVARPPPEAQAMQY